jgi:mannitol-1-phosphate 5-dehydrogenase
MLQSAEILMKKYPGEFTIGDLTDHIDDLLYRFENRALGDTVFRVGCDLKRKLHRDDRILAPLIDGFKTSSPVDKILLTFINGLFFRARDETGEMLPDDLDFTKILDKNGLEYVLFNICGLNQKEDRQIADMILAVYKERMK